MRMVMYHVASWFVPTFFGPYRSQWVVISTQAMQVAYHKTPESCTCVARLRHRRCRGGSAFAPTWTMPLAS